MSNRSSSDSNLRAVAKDLAHELSNRLIKRGMADYDVGNIIDMVIVKRLWAHWPDGPYESFKLWCWNVLHFKIRKAQYLRKNFLGLSALCSGPEGSFENTKLRAIRLGWSKLTYLLQMASSEMELIAWIDRVENENLRDIDLKKILALFKAGLIRDASTPIPETAPTSYGEDSGEDGSVGEQSGKDAQKCIRWTMSFTCQEDMTVFVDALEIIRNRTNPGMGLGSAAALMATSYLAHLPRSDEGGLATELQYLIEAIERHYGVRLITSTETSSVSYANTSPDYTSF